MRVRSLLSHSESREPPAREPHQKSAISRVLNGLNPVSPNRAPNPRTILSAVLRKSIRFLVMIPPPFGGANGPLPIASSASAIVSSILLLSPMASVCLSVSAAAGDEAISLGIDSSTRCSRGCGASSASAIAHGLVCAARSASAFCAATWADLPCLAIPSRTCGDSSASAIACGVAPGWASAKFCAAANFTSPGISGEFFIAACNTAGSGAVPASTDLPTYSARLPFK